MILFELKCRSDHRFEAWFRSNAAYEAREQGVIICPVCGDPEVVKAPMAPRIVRSAGERSAAESAATAAAHDPAPVAAPVPPATESTASPALTTAQAAQLLRQLTQLRQQVEEKCDYVGDRFAEEARRIHYGETSPRDIYGEATKDEARLLRDEGISVLSIPWVPRAN